MRIRGLDDVFSGVAPSLSQSGALEPLLNPCSCFSFFTPSLSLFPLLSLYLYFLCAYVLFISDICLFRSKNFLKELYADLYKDLINSIDYI